MENYAHKYLMDTERVVEFNNNEIMDDINS